LHASGTSVSDRIQIVQPGLEDSDIAAAPKPTLVVQKELGNVIIVETLPRANQGKMVVLYAAKPKSRKTDPDAPVSSRVQAPDRKGRLAHQGGFIDQPVSLSPQQNAFRRAEPNLSRGVLSRCANAPNVRRNFQALQMAGPEPFDCSR
jgi:hypothetical protein